MKRRPKLDPLDVAVLDAAEAYIAEVENPAPDLLYRATLRGNLAEAVNARREARMRRG